MRLIVEPAFWELFPDAVIGVVAAHRLDNQTPSIACREQLTAAIAAAAARLDGADIAQDNAVAPWREAYRKFGVKPAKYRSGIEGLLRATRNGGPASINPLVDCYNTVSLNHGLPCGGEDLGAIVGDLVLTRARGDEYFVPLGSAEAAPPGPGEVIYRDDAGAVCRCWNWREADRTKLTSATRDAVLVIEGLPPTARERVRAASDDLADSVRELLGAETRVFLLDRDVSEVDLAPDTTRGTQA